MFDTSSEADKTAFLTSKKNPQGLLSQHPISWLMTVLEDVLFVMHISQARDGLTY